MLLRHKINSKVVVIVMMITLLTGNTYNIRIDDRINEAANFGLLRQESLSVSDDIIVEILCNDEVINFISHFTLFQHNTKGQSETYRYGICLSGCLAALILLLILRKDYLLCDSFIVHRQHFIIRYIHNKDGKKG